MPGFISYSIENDEKFAQKIKAAYGVIGDLRIPFNSIAKDFRKSRRAIFKLTGPGGYPDFSGKKIGESRLAPLAEARLVGRRMLPIPESKNNYTPYQFRKERKYGFARGYPLLKATGRLEKSLTSLGGENILVVEKSAMLMGTSVPYAKYHQSDLPRTKIPLRKFLFIGPEAGNVGPDRGTLDRWLKIVDNYVTRSLKAVFAGEGSVPGESE